MDDRHNGKLLDATRLELFIALKYLIDKCNGKNNLSKATDLTKYAKDNFKVNLDRRRVNSIFNALASFTRDNPNVLPYKIIKVYGKPRYYVEKCLFDKKEAEKIAKAIKNDSSLSSNVSDKYANDFLNKVCSPEEKENIINKLNRKTAAVEHISNEVSENVSFFELLSDEKRRFYFRLKKTPKTSKCINKKAYYEAHKLAKAEEEQSDYYCAGIIFDMYITDEKIEMCIYLQDLRTAFIVNMADIVMNENFEPVQQWREVKFILEDCEFSSLDDWVKKYYKGNTGLQYDITFKFYAGDEELFKARKKSFEKFFKKEMEYELVERKYVVPGYQGEEEVEIVQDAVVSVTCNYQAFSKWYWESGAYANTVILEPKRLNNRLLTMMTARFINRMEKYGETAEEREARLQAFREERRARFEAAREKRLARRESVSEGPRNNK